MLRFAATGIPAWYGVAVPLQSVGL